MSKRLKKGDSSSTVSVLPTYKKTTLPNGIRVVTEQISHVRSVSLGVWIDVGSRNEKEENNGITHFIEHMLFKGTKRYKVHEIAQSLESVGGYLNAFTTKEHTCYYARTLDEHLPLAIDVLSDMVQFPIFDKKEMEKEKLVVIEEIKNIDDSPDELIYDYFDQNLFGKHAIGMPIIGKPDNIHSFTRDGLFSYLHDYYNTSNIVVSAAGNLEHEKLVDLVEKLFTGKKAKQKGNLLSQSKISSTRKISEYEKPITQAHVCLGRVGYSIRHKNRYPLLVLNTLLGEGMSSRLFQTLRERHGMAYSIYSFANFLSDTGTFGVYIGTDAEKISKAIALIQNELEKLCTKNVTMKELNRTKAQLKGSLMLSLENMSNRMMRLGSSELYTGEHILLDEIVKKVDAVTQDQLIETARQMFKQDQFSTVIIKPQAKAA